MHNLRMVVFFEWLRRTSFWALDVVKGGSVRRHYKEIQAVLAAPESEKAIEIRKRNLNNLLKVAVSTVPIYKKMGLAPCSLEDFPVVNKYKVREHFESFQNTDLRNGKNYLVTTSGSTGSPFSLYQDKNKKTRNTADTIFFAERAG